MPRANAVDEYWMTDRPTVEKLHVPILLASSTCKLYCLSVLWTSNKLMKSTYLTRTIQQVWNSKKLAPIRGCFAWIQVGTSRYVLYYVLLVHRAQKWNFHRTHFYEYEFHPSNLETLHECWRREEIQISR